MDLKTDVSAAPGLCAPNARALIVDDNEINLEVVSAVLEPTRMMIRAVMSGREALEFSLKEKYDVILMDHLMPEMDGIECLKNIRSQEGGLNRTAPAVVLTANARSADREIYFSAGFDAYLIKPVSSKALHSVLMRLISQDKIIHVDSHQEENVSEVKEIGESAKWYESIEGIDANAGIKTSESEEEFKTVLKLFYNAIDRKADELDGYYSEEDFENYTIKVHALKSSCRIIGAVGTSNKAQLLENAGKEGRFEYIKENHPAFISEYRRYKDHLGKIFDDEHTPDEDKPAKPVADESFMSGFYERLCQGANAMDCDIIEDVLKELDDYAVPENEANKIEALRQKADQFDYDGILEILNGYHNADK